MGQQGTFLIWEESVEIWLPEMQHTFGSEGITRSLYLRTMPRSGYFLASYSGLVRNTE